jgi:hypothetical protein
MSGGLLPWASPFLTATSIAVFPTQTNLKNANYSLTRFVHSLLKLNTESAKQFYKIRTLYPIFYQQLVDLFPEMLVQERYWSQFDAHGVINIYSNKGWGAIFEYIETQIEDPVEQELAKQRVQEAQGMRRSNLSQGKYRENFGGYPIRYVFRAIIAGQFKRVILPIGKATKEDIEYERQCEGREV